MIPVPAQATVLTCPEEDVPAVLRRQMRALQEEAWPSSDPACAASDAPVHDPALRPVSMLLVADGTVLAALDVLTKEITHAGRRWAAGGLSTVVTRRAARGQGHGRRLVSAAREAMARAGLEVGLFTCDRPLQGFYESAGWRHLPGAVLVGGTPEEPFPSDWSAFDKVTMACFFTPGSRAAEPSFRDSRIALFPGAIDKLW
ncbi:GNAT family N-acetyltransferase [Streptomyces sp. Ru71]|uniref:GNAT family N-acetyltransferase n=1 Tax=Streptomyces sp. Ru71 TaxID=2080746 RepID=UPI0021561C3C|nr:GNAT family N-acetyltransferase [Streptomyces sp. Ru71]